MTALVRSAAALLICAIALPVVGQPKARPSRLKVHGTRFVGADGSRFEWRGITAFRLLEMIARGRTKDVEAYLDWCAKQELTVVRVLTMAKHLFELDPAEGRAALPRLLEMAHGRGLYVEIVGLADTAEIPLDIDRHIREIGVIAAKHPNAVVEIANEPVHATQTVRIHDPGELERLARLVPDEVPVALGAADDERFAGGDYATVHLSRDSGDDGWAHVTALAAAAQLLRKWGKPVVNDEPIGAGNQLDPGRRDDSPERFRAAALLTRMIGLGATFHYEGGLQTRVPAGREGECFDAWQEAWTLLPAGGAFTLLEPGAQGSPVQSVKGEFAGAYVAVRGESAWLLVTRTRGEIGVTWAEGWQPAKRKTWNESMWIPAVRVAMY
jgi:hypothetical protein